MTIERNEISRLLQLSNDDIFAEIGQQVISRRVLLPTRLELINEAKRWFEERRSNIIRKVCKSKRIKDLVNRSSAESTRLYLISAVADVILSATGNVAPLTVAVLLVRQGVKSLCAELWSKIESKRKTKQI